MSKDDEEFYNEQDRGPREEAGLCLVEWLILGAFVGCVVWLLCNLVP